MKKNEKSSSQGISAGATKQNAIITREVKPTTHNYRKNRNMKFILTTCCVKIQKIYSTTARQCIYPHYSELCLSLVSSSCIHFNKQVGFCTHLYTSLPDNKQIKILNNLSGLYPNMLSWKSRSNQNYQFLFHSLPTKMCPFQNKKSFGCFEHGRRKAGLHVHWWVGRGTQTFSIFFFPPDLD